MIKNPIGIIDMNTNNIALLNELNKEFKNESFIYVNDWEYLDYEGLTLEKIRKRVKENFLFLLKKKVKLIIVVSNTIVEYCSDFFDEVSVPVINIVDTITSYINDHYEHKNMVLLASQNIINANIYQKNINYNHLYSIPCNNLDEVLIQYKVKTNTSFVSTKEAFRAVMIKDVDIIIPTHFNLMMLKTEIIEYMNDTMILDINTLFIDKIKAALLTLENLSSKGKGSIEVCINTTLHQNSLNVLNFKFKLITKKDGIN